MYASISLRTRLATDVVNATHREFSYLVHCSRNIFKRLQMGFIMRLCALLGFGQLLLVPGRHLLSELQVGRKTRGGSTGFREGTFGSREPGSQIGDMRLCHLMFALPMY